MRISRTFLYIFALMLLLGAFVKPESVQGATYYVDNLKGGDTNSGLSGKPWATLRKASKSVKPGDTVIIVSNGSDYPYREVISLRNSGTPDQWITIRGESPTDMPRIVGNGSNALFSCYEKNYVKIRDLIFENTSDGGMGFFNCSHLELYNIKLRNIGKNGIGISGGGSNYLIDSCVISNVSNSGIALIGYDSRKLSNTIIQNCIVSDVRGNDGITLHKNSAGFDIGINHIIRNNILTNCGEQGIDITSGQNVIVENNRTSGNGDSGIIVGHKAMNVSIKSHVSIDEKKYGIIIGESQNVFIMDSKIINPGSNAALRIYKSDGLTIKNNIIEHGSFRTNGSLIDVEPESRNLRFEGNTFSVPQNYSGVAVRYSTNLVSSGSSWVGNKWAIPSRKAKFIHLVQDGILNFDQFKTKYAPTDELYTPQIDQSTRIENMP